MMKIRETTLAITLTLTLLSGIGHAQEHDHSKMNMMKKKGTSEVVKYQVDKAFTEQLSAVFKTDLKLNQFFFSEDAVQVAAAAKEVSDELKKVDMMLLEGDAHMAWMSYLKSIKIGLNEITGAATILEQREAFDHYNQALFTAFKAYGTDLKVFLIHCPMANENKGGVWLSERNEIHNPYLGNKMPTCGMVKETIN